ncbi:MAG: tetratricopeptide repeat protein [Caulobacteraceae bacterium]|nr:tetratricopeptide repeat protein [Caulobacteraceae bacterium]
MRIFLAAALAAGALMFAAPASAQNDESICGEQMNNYTPQQLIASCTTLINRGGYDNANLAILYSNRGSGFRRAGDLRSSLADHNRALQLAPSDGISYFNRANTLRDMEDLDGAITDYNLALRYQAGYRPAYMERAWCYQRRGEHNLAIADYTMAIGINASDGDAYIGRANSYIDQRQYDPALADLAQAERLMPNQALPRYNRGVVYERLGRYPEAIVEYSAAAAFDPRDADALGNRGNLRVQAGDAAGGVADLSAALAIREGYIDLHNRGHGFVALGDYPHALADFDRAFALNADTHDYDNDRCWYRIMTNTELSVARAACDRGVAGFADNATERANVLDSRGMLNLREARFQDAWNDYNTAAQLVPGSASYAFGRGVAAQRLGRTDAARADFATAMTIDPEVSARYASWGFPVDAALLPRR